MLSEFELKPFYMAFRVYMEDTDSMGIMYHANYLKFFERARSDMWRQHGIFLTSMAECGTHFAIRHLNIQYLSPARLDDMVKITTTMKKVGACTLSFVQEMRHETERVLSQAQVQVVCLNEQMKPRKLPNLFECGDSSK